MRLADILVHLLSSAFKRFPTVTCITVRLPTIIIISKQGRFNVLTPVLFQVRRGRLSQELAGMLRDFNGLITGSCRLAGWQWPGFRGHFG